MTEDSTLERQERAQRLQDHMEQHHGLCLPASAWDAAVSAVFASTEQATDAVRPDVVERLIADLKHAEDAIVAHCEGCAAPLFDGDDFATGPEDGVSGCWAAMTDMPSKRERPCFSYRVGKPSAMLSASPPSPLVDEVDNG